MINNHKIIFTTFAGRQDRMSILVKYVNKALEMNLIDEWHVWDYARKESDRAWLNTLEKINNKIKLFSPKESSNEDMRKSEWGSYYSHYNLNNYTKETVIIKCDDDIVFIDLNNLKKFIEFRITNQQYFLVSANVINNGVCAGLQQSYGAFSKDIDPPEGIPYESVCGKLWSRGDLSNKLHNYFIDNKEKFIKNSYYEQPIGERISINFISYLGKDFVYTQNVDRDDEAVMSMQIPYILKRKNCVYLNLLVSHLSFHSQENTMNVEEILENYKEMELKNEIKKVETSLDI